MQSCIAYPTRALSLVPPHKTVPGTAGCTATTKTWALMGGLKRAQFFGEHELPVLWRSKTSPCKKWGKPSFELLANFQRSELDRSRISKKARDPSKTIANFELRRPRFLGRADFHCKVVKAFLQDCANGRFQRTITRTAPVKKWILRGCVKCMMCLTRTEYTSSIYDKKERTGILLCGDG